MKFTMPTEFPTRQEFLELTLTSIFPDLDDLNKNPTGHGYTVACDGAADETGISSKTCPAGGLQEDSNIFRLMYELFLFRTGPLCEKTPSLMVGKDYKAYDKNIFTFTDTVSGSLKNWYGDVGPTKKINKSFDAALFFSYQLLSRPECAQNRQSYFEKCLEFVGISEIEDSVRQKLFDFDWTELGDKAQFKNVGFTRLKNRAVRLLAYTELVIFELLGVFNSEKKKNKEQPVARAKLSALFQTIQGAFQEESVSCQAADAAEKTLQRNISKFEPRSIQVSRSLLPQDYFVLPEFERSDHTEVQPFAEIRAAQKSKRLLITAKTGQGKSVFLQMATLCMLQKRLAGAEQDEKIRNIAKELQVPEDMFVISVPARMFSFCYSDERYKDWTGDFVELFFRVMWKLSGGYNFYTTLDPQSNAVPIVDSGKQEYQFDDALQGYLQELARAGKLLLVLDSYDEITRGKMRTAYNNALTAFYHKYCCYPEQNDVGAHVIISSRMMSAATMNAMKRSLQIGSSQNSLAEDGVLQIRPMNHAQRAKLVYNWCTFQGKAGEADAILAQIEDNHYYWDYALNPYMLSVLTFCFGQKLGSITHRYISALVDKMNNNNLNAEMNVKDVLRNIERILQKVALDSVMSGSPKISQDTLNGYLREEIPKEGLTDWEVDTLIDRLHEIFVTEVGLIVPADEADEDYQFINSQIRFELAAKGIRRGMTSSGNAVKSHAGSPLSIDSVSDYTQLLVPLLCDINLENVQLAETLVADLVMHDFQDGEEEKTLICAMVDLLLGRYGGSIGSAGMPGARDAKYVRRAQRMLLMRVFTSRSFAPTEKEKAELKKSQVLQSSLNWFAQELLDKLNAGEESNSPVQAEAE